MERLRTVIVSLLLLISGNAMSENVYLCDGCYFTSEASSIAARQGSGTFSLADIDHEIIATYQIQSFYEEGVRRYFAKPIKTPVDTLSSYNDVIFNKRELDRIIQALEIPPDIARSAYDLANAPYMQSRVANYVVDNFDVIATARLFLLGIANLAVQALNEGYHIPFSSFVHFEDGSVAEFAMGPTRLTNTPNGLVFNWVPENSHDAEGNRIPGSLIDLEANYYFSGLHSETYQAFNRAVINNFGWNINIVSAGATQYVCSGEWHGTTVTVVCHPVY